MKLVVVESPNKVKKIRSFLGNGYKVGASFGHIRDLPDKGGLGVDFKDGHIDAHYVVTKKDMASQLKRLAQGADEVLIATDPDREGEAIGWHIVQLLGPTSYTYKRVTFNQITKRAVQDAVANPGQLNMDLVNAQQARRVFDRVVGWVVSPTLRKGLANKSARSAGRVQSTALRLVVEREQAIQAFDQKEYYEIEAQLQGHEPPPFTASLFEWQQKKLEHRLQDKQQAQDLADLCKPGPWTLAHIDRKQSKKHAPPPFTTSTAQQAASVTLKYAPEQCMKALQALFEAGHITYHRTDSVSLSPEAITLARTIIAERFGAEYVPEQALQHKSKVANAQEAHEAIRPTHPEHGPQADAIKEYQDLYALIWERYVASQMAAGIDDVTVYQIKTASCAAVLFRARGSVCVFDGWRRIGDTTSEQKSKGKKQEDVVLPALQVGDQLDLKKLSVKKKSTKPPPRYTQASLIKEMEKQGIGRPSTYASIMKTIMMRKYVKELKRKLHATELGMSVCQWLINHYKGNFIEIAYTSSMEERLDAMSRGELDWQACITEESELLVQISQRAGLTYNPLHGEKPIASQPAEGVACPSCKGPMREIKGPHGTFFGCMKYPKCKGTRPGKEEAAQQKDAPSCPQCEAPMRLRKSAHGPFWGCSTFPKCKGTRPKQDNESQPDAGTAADATASPRVISSQEQTSKNDIGSSATSTKNGSSPSCPECGSEMYRVPGRGGAADYYTCRYAPECDGQINLDDGQK